MLTATNSTRLFVSAISLTHMVTNILRIMRRVAIWTLVILALGLALAPKAAGAPPSQVASVIARVKAHGTKTMTVGETSDGYVEPITIWDLKIPACGNGADVNVTDVEISASAIITSVHVTTLSTTGTPIVIVDMNSDGTVDSFPTGPGLSQSAAQLIYDTTMTCSARKS